MSVSPTEQRERGPLRRGDRHQGAAAGGLPQPRRLPGGEARAARVVPEDPAGGPQGEHPQSGPSLGWVQFEIEK